MGILLGYKIGVVNFCFFSCIFLATKCQNPLRTKPSKHQNISNPKHQNPLKPKPSNQQTHPTTHHQTQLTTISTTTNHHHHGGLRQKKRDPSRERPTKRETLIWAKERVKHRSLRERHRFEQERDPPVWERDKLVWERNMRHLGLILSKIER